MYLCTYPLIVGNWKQVFQQHLHFCLSRSLSLSLSLSISPSWHIFYINSDMADFYHAVDLPYSDLGRHTSCYTGVREDGPAHFQNARIDGADFWFLTPPKGVTVHRPYFWGRTIYPIICFGVAPSMHQISCAQFFFPRGLWAVLVLVGCASLSMAI